MYIYLTVSLLGGGRQRNPTEFWAGTQVPPFWHGLDAHGFVGATKSLYKLKTSSG